MFPLLSRAVGLIGKIIVDISFSIDEMMKEEKMKEKRKCVELAVFLLTICLSFAAVLLPLEKAEGASGSANILKQKIQKIKPGETKTFGERKEDYVFELTADSAGDYSFELKGTDLYGTTLTAYDAEGKKHKELEFQLLGDDGNVPCINYSLKAGEKIYLRVQTWYQDTIIIYNEDTGEDHEGKDKKTDKFSLRAFRNDSTIKLKSIEAPAKVSYNEDLVIPIVFRFDSENGCGRIQIQYRISSEDGSRTGTFIESEETGAVRKGNCKTVLFYDFKDGNYIGPREGETLTIEGVTLSDIYGKPTQISASELKQACSVSVTTGTQREAIAAAGEIKTDEIVDVKGDFTVEKGEILTIPAGVNVWLDTVTVKGTLDIRSKGSHINRVNLSGNLKTESDIYIAKITAVKGADISGKGKIITDGGELPKALLAKVEGTYNEGTEKMRCGSDYYYWNSVEWKKKGVRTDISKLNIFSLKKTTVTFSGKPQRPEILINGKDDGGRYGDMYDDSWKNDFLPGKAQVILKGKGKNFYGSVTLKFTIKPRKLSKEAITISGTDFDYTGKEVKPTVSVEGLKKGKNYTVSYKNNVKIGTAQVVIKGIGNTTGTVKRKFTISVKDDMKLTSGDLHLIVLNAKKKTVSVKGMKGQRKKVSIPETVKIGGKNFKIAGIEKKAFSGKKKIERITIGKNVTHIGKNVFSGCVGLEALKIKTKKLTEESVADGAFSGIGNKAKVVVPSRKLKAYRKLLAKKGLPKAVTVTK